MNLIAVSAIVAWIYAPTIVYRFLIWNEDFFKIETTLQAELVARTFITKPLSYLTFNFPRDIFFLWYQIFFHIMPFTLTLFATKNYHHEISLRDCTYKICIRWSKIVCFFFICKIYPRSCRRGVILSLHGGNRRR